MRPFTSQSRKNLEDRFLSKDNWYISGWLCVALQFLQKSNTEIADDFQFSSTLSKTTLCSLRATRGSLELSIPPIGPPVIVYTIIFVMLICCVLQDITASQRGGLALRLVTSGWMVSYKSRHGMHDNLFTILHIWAHSYHDTCTPKCFTTIIKVWLHLSHR